MLPRFRRPSLLRAQNGKVEMAPRHPVAAAEFREDGKRFLIGFAGLIQLSLLVIQTAEIAVGVCLPPHAAKVFAWSSC